MDRRDVILKYITKAHLGIEIGPYLWPLTPKRDGYNCLVMDVFDTDALKALATRNGYSAEQQQAQLEAVDLVGSSTHIDEVVAEHHRLGSFDYIVSSHNFEHLPNPIRFLQGCARVLRPGGLISMAMPDRRACYDYFRSLTPLSEWLEAYFEGRRQPSLAQVFDNKWMRCTYDHHGEPYGSFFRGAPPTGITVGANLQKDFDEWLEGNKLQDRDYEDAHCSVFTPASFELLIRDASYLGLIPFEIVEISESPGVDFFAHLRAVANPAVLRPADYESIRDALAHRVLDEASETSTLGHEARVDPVDNIHRRFDELVDEIRQNTAPANSGTSAEGLCQQIQHIQTGFEMIRQQMATLDSNLVSRDAEREHYRTELAIAHEKTLYLVETISALRASTSWRLTAPLRRLVSAWRGRV
ncbi:methyltransferase domain-containing protein [Caballeronia sp. BR00000012568055]|uniref:methyltransferase domain-containing protein n=1 Tax=Caballeronia sp. BR00000012568055 TaxID=2918761 RepID=UPI0023F61F18|nr:methyltransferase domain-containing protein [Caballeronia sp. BR00000012568055]